MTNYYTIMYIILILLPLNLDCMISVNIFEDKLRRYNWSNKTTKQFDRNSLETCCNKYITN